jgi:hypothetical protein
MKISDREVFVAATHIDVKKGQDRSVQLSGDTQGVMLCDGIGSLAHSAKYAEEATVVFKASPSLPVKKIAEAVQHKLDVPGGTTVLRALIKTTDTGVPRLSLSCLGNGSAVHLTGHFNAERPDGIPHYRYTELFLSHTNEGTALMRHVSHDSRAEHHDAFELEMSLNHPYGDIILLFTDGLSSSEERLVVKTPDERIWRNESENLHRLLQRLDNWLTDVSRHQLKAGEIQTGLENFVSNFVEEMKVTGNLEDDLALGLIVTRRVVERQQKMTKQKAR